MYAIKHAVASVEVILINGSHDFQVTELEVCGRQALQTAAGRTLALQGLGLVTAYVQGLNQKVVFISLYY